jgi:hypothetical protein
MKNLQRVIYEVIYEALADTYLMGTCDAAVNAVALSPFLAFASAWSCWGCFALGLGWILASLQVYLRDTAQVLTVILTFWFWLTPIFIAEKQFPARVRFLLAGNPLAYLVRGDVSGGRALLPAHEAGLCGRTVGCGVGGNTPTSEKRYHSAIPVHYITPIKA